MVLVYKQERRHKPARTPAKGLLKDMLIAGVLACKLKPFYIQEDLTFMLVNYDHFISLNAQPAAGPLEDFLLAPLALMASTMINPENPTQTHHVPSALEIASQITHQVTPPSALENTSQITYQVALPSALENGSQITHQVAPPLALENASQITQPGGATMGPRECFRNHPPGGATIVPRERFPNHPPGGVTISPGERSPNHPPGGATIGPGGTYQITHQVVPPSAPDPLL